MFSEVTKKRCSLLVGGDKFLSDLGQVKEVLSVLVAMQYHDTIESVLTRLMVDLRYDLLTRRKDEKLRSAVAADAGTTSRSLTNLHSSLKITCSPG